MCVCVLCPLCPPPAILLSVMPLHKSCTVLVVTAWIFVLQSWTEFGRSTYQKQSPFPYSQIVFFLSILWGIYEVFFENEIVYGVCLQLVHILRNIVTIITVSDTFFANTRMSMITSFLFYLSVIHNFKSPSPTKCFVMPDFQVLLIH